MIAETIMLEGRRTSARSRIYMMVRANRLKDALWAFDIGLGGLQCQSRAVMFPGTYLDLSFRLPGTRELLKVGAQVAALGETPSGDASGGVALGLRFCRLSARAQLSIYRFLDKRRSLWTSRDDAPQETAARPFEGLLLDAYTALQAQELRELGFVCTPWPNDLQATARHLPPPMPVKPIVLQ